MASLQINEDTGEYELRPGIGYSKQEVAIDFFLSELQQVFPNVAWGKPDVTEWKLRDTNESVGFRFRVQPVISPALPGWHTAEMYTDKWLFVTRYVIMYEYNNYPERLIRVKATAPYLRQLPAAFKRACIQEKRSHRDSIDEGLRAIVYAKP